MYNISRRNNDLSSSRGKGHWREGVNSGGALSFTRRVRVIIIQNIIIYSFGRIKIKRQTFDFDGTVSENFYPLKWIFSFFFLVREYKKLRYFTTPRVSQSDQKSKNEYIVYFFFCLDENILFVYTYVYIFFFIFR